MFLLFFLPIVSGQCPEGRELTFSKVSGFAPSLPAEPPLLYASSHGAPVTAECYNRCRSSSDCLGFILDYARSSCFRVPEVADYRDQLTEHPGSSYFTKLCLSLPENCSSRAWSTELTPGFELADQKDVILTGVEDKWKCAQLCIERRNSSCSSANYHSDAKTCVLNVQDKWMRPDYFMPNDKFDYIENHCIASETKKCFHEPVYEHTSVRGDRQIEKVSLEQCEEDCREETNFRCRGYSYLPDLQECLLSSDLSHGRDPFSPSLAPSPSGLYVEAISCINMTVSCDKDSLNVTLYSPKFGGRMFTQDNSERCYTDGKGDDTTVLQMDLSDLERHKCGVNVAYSVGTINRTLVSAIVVVQKHQLILTATDQVTKVSCLILPPELTEHNISLSFGLQVSEPEVQSIISSGGDLSSPPVLGGARASMTVVDAKTGELPKRVSLGDLLLLRIQIEPPYDASQVRAGHLIASSGSHRESLLLLDVRGCPPPRSVVPALSVIDSHTLGTKFQAFRFASSSVLTLSVVLTMCPNGCQPVDCGNGVRSYGRKKRSVVMYQEIPLQLAIVVHSSDPDETDVTPVPGEPNDTALYPASLAGIMGAPQMRANEGKICMDFLTAALVGLFWLLLQCILLAVGCWVLGRKEKEYADTISLRHDFQPRHVSWSDDIDSEGPRSLRLSTPMRA